MMIYAILNKLKNDADLISLLRITEEDSRIYPLSTTNFGPCLVYNDSPIGDDGRTKVNRLEMRIIDTDYDNMLLIEKALNEIMIIPEDEPGYIYGSVNIMSCSQNGGGTLEHDGADVFERIIYYEIKWRRL